MGKSKLPAEDFVQKHVPGDGSCLFHAVSAGLEQGSTAGELRGLAASCLAKQVDAEFNGATLRQWIEWETGLGPAEYAALMRGGGGWGGQIELALLSKCLQRPIQVFSPAQSDGYVLDHEFQPQAGFEGNAPVRVVFSGAHYDALLPKTPTRSAVTMQAEEGSSAMSAQNLYKLFEQRKYRVGQCVEGFPAPKGDEHTATVIWLHGLGDSGFGWAPVAAQLEMPWVKFLFPTAPVQPVSLNMGMEMPAWFDLTSLDPDAKQEDAIGIQQSAGYLLSLVEKEVEGGIPHDRIVLAGFSQGGAIALTAGLCVPDVKVAGVVALSTWLPLTSSPAQDQVKVLMGHGDSDNVVLYRWGQQSCKLLQNKGIAAEFKTYPGMDHNFCPEELDDVGAFLRQCLPPL